MVNHVTFFVNNYFTHTEIGHSDSHCLFNLFMFVIYDVVCFCLFILSFISVGPPYYGEQDLS